MGATFADLISDVESDLYSFTQGNDQTAWLTQACTAADTVFYLNDSSSFGTGFMEITSSAGNELIYVSSRDESANTVTAPPWGRAQRSTTALAHPANSRVVANPMFPRSKIAAFINEALRDLYPDIFIVDYVDLPLLWTQRIYDLPADCEGLVDAQVMYDLRPEQGWRPLRRMHFNYNDKTLDLGWESRDNHTLRLTYRKVVGTLTNPTDLLTSTGLAEDMRSLVRLFAYYKMLNSLQGQKLELSSLESAAMTQLRQPDYLNNTIKTVYSQYQLALQGKRNQLQQQYPPLRYRLP